MPILHLWLRFCVFGLCLFLLGCNKAENKLSPDFKYSGMDFLIVSTSTPEQQSYWEGRLEELKGTLIKPEAYVIVIQEQWPGGAGNGFGTLYAYQKARQKAQELYNIDVLDYQRQGHTVAIYHTSGQGKRMSPLTASEKNNKSAVKLPSGLPFAKDHTLSVLEAVIWQSAGVAPQRSGRLSVFWGDQIFLPKNQAYETSEHEIEIFAKGQSMPDREQWQRQGLEKYGFFAFTPQGSSTYLEKASFDTIEQLILDEKMAADQKVCISLGSFSLSADMTAALLEEFSEELSQKNGMMNVEHSLWMPLTLDLDTYATIMKSNGWPQELSVQQHMRMTAFKHRFLSKYPEASLLGVSDIGEEGHWWDYGTIDNYFGSLQKLIGTGEESEAMRDFYKIPPREASSKGSLLEIDATSIVLGSSIERGSIKNSIVVDVIGKNVDFDSSVAISCSFNGIAASDSLYYNVVEKQNLTPPSKTVRADLVLNTAEEPIKIMTNFGRDGKSDWEKRLEGNPYSYSELEKINQKQ